VAAGAPETPAETYERLLAQAREDPRVLAFWLGGSRGMGRPTEHSDWDVGMIVAEEAYDAFCAELGLEAPFQAEWRPGVDLAVRTFPSFEAFAAWGTDEAVYRYTFAHLKALVDKTGRAQPLIDAKACVPTAEIGPFLAAKVDYLLNQVYRAMKCLRDGDPEASRLEAAEGVTPFLDALFAVHGGRLRPYYKYLRFELAEHPLKASPLGPQALLAALMDVLSPGAAKALQRLAIATWPLFEAHGCAAVYQGWGGALDWMLNPASLG